MSGIYIASKWKHADKWKALRDSGVPIVSTWLDDVDAGYLHLTETVSRRIREASTASALVLYTEPRERQKLAFVELGAALAHGVPVFSVGPCNSWIAYHDLVTVCGSLDDAIALARKVA